MLIIHGDNLPASQKALETAISEIKKGGHEINHIDVSATDPTSLRQQLDATNLFGTTPTLIIQNLFSGPKSKAKELFKKILSDHQDQPHIIYADKKITDANLKIFNKSKVEHFKPGNELYQFLDQIIPGNSTRAIHMLPILAKQDIQGVYLFTVLHEHIRSLIIAHSTPSLLPARIPPFAKQKLTQQSKKFSESQLLSIHNKIYQADKSIKTGLSTLSFDDFIYSILSNL